MTTQQHIEAVRKVYPDAQVSLMGLVGCYVYETFDTFYPLSQIGFGGSESEAWQDAYNNLPKNKEQ